MTKVSKTKLNTIDPDELLNEHGADAVRLVIVSDTPPDRDQPWSDEGLEGARRFLRRLWNMVHEDLDALQAAEPFAGDPTPLSGGDAALCRTVHQTIKSATEDYEVTRHFNTALARVFELVNAIRASKSARPAVLRLAYETVVKLLAPVTPHICAELWETLGGELPLVEAAWPEHDEAALKTDNIEVVVQVNGKLRATVTVPADAGEDAVRELALADENVKKHIEGKEVVKVIVVPGRLVNVVVK